MAPGAAKETDPTLGVAARMLRPFAAILRRHGEDADKALAERGISLEHFDGVDHRISHVAAVQILQLCAELTVDPAVGLHAAESWKPGDYGVVEYAVRATENLGRAFEIVNRYVRLEHSAARAWLEVQGDHVLWCHDVRHGLTLPAIASDYIVAAHLTAARRFTNLNLRPLEVLFMHSATPYATEYERVLRAPVRFDCPYNGLVMPREALDIRLEAPDPGLLKVLESHAQQMLSQLPQSQSVATRARDAILGELRGGNPNIDHVARKLGMSERTLRRRLRAEDTSHSQVLDELRRGLAERHLGTNDLAVSEIAFLLGFAHVNAFHKAFKRWTGIGPAEFRRRGRAS